MELHAVIHEEPDGSYWAEVKELPGCFASGHDLYEVKEGLIEAINLVLEDDGTQPAGASIRLDELKLITA